MIDLSMNFKKTYTDQIRTRYLSANKYDKAKILDEYCNICNYNRKHAIRALNSADKQETRVPRKGPRPQYPQEEILEPLAMIWIRSGRPCSKVLVGVLREWLGAYQRKYGMLKPELVNKLLTISSSTIDRLLRNSKFNEVRKGISGTKPGTLLKAHINLSDNAWDYKKPGYFEADTVALCGDSLNGQFIWCLNMTDIATGWTEVRSCWGKSSEAILDKIKEIESDLPMPLLGFDSDNGSEFLNYKILEYMQKRKHPVQFTRSRPYQKNDNAHVEQKNYTHVRKLLGYARYDLAELSPMVNSLLREDWCKLNNFFMPCQKTVKKYRVGSKIKRVMDEPMTPYKRLMATDAIDTITRRRLADEYQSMNPFDLRENIDKKLEAIIKRLKATNNFGLIH